MRAMTAFPGFGISGYRTLSGEAQWIPLDAAVTVFLGGNNSGKSNVLRALHLHMGAIFRSLRDGRDLEGLDARLDSPRGSGDEGLEIHWPLDVHLIRDSGRFDSVRDDLERLLELPQLNQCGMTALPFTS